MLAGRFYFRHITFTIPSSLCRLFVIIL